MVELLLRNDMLLKLSCGNLVDEEMVEFLVGSIGGLWKERIS